MGAMVAAGLVAILGVLMAGPLPVEAPRWKDAGPAVWPTMPPQPTAEATLPPFTGAPIASAVIRIVLTVLFGLVIAFLVFLVAVFVIRRIRDRRRRVRGRSSAASAFGAEGVSEAAIAAPAVRRGIARALEILDEQRPPDDAIVAAWLGLEDAAQQAGARRRPSETPAEYAARIIRRFETNRSATDILLRLYEDVRFGGRHADDGSVRTARECLVHLQRSWHDTESEHAGGRDSGGGS
jgi:hypothetical protein